MSTGPDEQFEKVSGHQRGIEDVVGPNEAARTGDIAARGGVSPPPHSNQTARETLSQRLRDTRTRANELDFLGRHASWLLVIFGIALLVTGVVIARKEAVAVVLAFSGVGVFVIGVLLSQLEGTIELGPTRLKAQLRRAREVSFREDLTLEEKADLLMRIIGTAPGGATEPEFLSEVSAVRPGVSEEMAEPSTASQPPLPAPLSFIVTGATDQLSQVARAFETHVARVFRQSGWEVVIDPRFAIRPYDLQASKDSWTLYIETKLRRRIGAADIERLLLNWRSGGHSDRELFVVATNQGALTHTARQLLDDARDALVFEVPVQGW